MPPAPHKSECLLNGAWDSGAILAGAFLVALWLEVINHYRRR